MNKSEIGFYFSKYYQKRTASFLANIYKASITGDSKDIHRARLDVKRIFALYDLFGLLDPGEFRLARGHKLFRPIYRQAGKIRELQVNYLLLSEFDPTRQLFPVFLGWMKDHETLAVQRMMRKIKQFDLGLLEKTGKNVEKLCTKGSAFKLHTRTSSYLFSKADQVLELLNSDPGVKELHRIRRHLKSAVTIAGLAYSVKPEKWFDDVISAINTTEMMIGAWHDRIVMLETLHNFHSAEIETENAEALELKRFEDRLQTKCRDLVQDFLPEAGKIVELIKERQEAVLSKA